MSFTTLTRSGSLPATPISTTEAKAHLRVDGSTDDDLIARYIAGATDWVEKETNRALVEQTWVMRLDDFPRDSCARGRYIELPKPPVVSITSIAYVDTAGATQTLASNLYSLVADDWQPFVCEVYGTTWPTVRSQPGAVTVTYLAGYPKSGADYGANVPGALKSALWMHVQGQYDNLPAADWQALERAIRNMILPYRVPVI